MAAGKIMASMFLDLKSVFYLLGVQHRLIKCELKPLVRKVLKEKRVTKQCSNSCDSQC